VITFNKVSPILSLKDAAQALTHQLWEDLLPLARHEAGHYVVARCLGFSPGEIRLKITGAHVIYPDHPGVWLRQHEGSCFVNLDEVLQTTEAVRDWLDRRIQALLAGALAQSLGEEGPNGVLAAQFLETNAAGDHKIIQTFVLLARNMACPLPTSGDEGAAQNHVIFKRNWDRALALVQTEAAVIEGLANVVAGHALKSRPVPKDVIERLAVIKDRFGQPAAP
jgi:hypothetical protein